MYDDDEMKVSIANGAEPEALPLRKILHLHFQWAEMKILAWSGNKVLLLQGE